MRLNRNLLLLAVASIAIAPAQTVDVADWQTAAGGKMTFDVASVKPSERPRRPNFQLNTGNSKPHGGRFSATSPLWTYIAFAYKLSFNNSEYRANVEKTPKWFSTELFEIEARAEGNPTKDQIRLMMQSLLAERFKLAVHFDQREVSVFALTLIKPGQTGPKLRPHAQGPACPEAFEGFDPPPGDGEWYPPSCETLLIHPGKNRTLLVGSRNTAMPSIAEAIYFNAFNAGEVDRPVVDRTGLDGRFDFIMEYSLAGVNPFTRPDSSNSNALPPDPQGTSVLAAVREQLGMKLTPSKALLRTIVIDHVERPSGN